MSKENYESILDSLKSRKIELKARLQEIEELETAISMFSKGSPVIDRNTLPTKKHFTLPSKEKFSTMSISDATREILTIKGEACSAIEICKQLKQGGIKHSSANFSKTVSAALHQASKNKEIGIVNISRGVWGLSEWSK